MSVHAEAIITAGLRPDLFAGRGVLANSKTLVFAALIVLVIAGLGFRVTGLSAEGLSEDELNKLNAVADYRAHGLTGANGEHPMLMKACQAVSIILAEKWNNTFLSNPIAPETALRLPTAVVGALSAILIFLITSELFGVEVALIAAALWAFDPSAIGLNRIAKEDSFLLFFNAHHEPIEFTLPPTDFGASWVPVIYTADTTAEETKPVAAGAKVAVDARALMVLQAATD